ncbi:early activation antigen CD69-like [Eublepharis macularius]|uniref:Early activation antigen CD69-like n=1 Tax=Eublepharis macularius TaxID=481883 RepID=A0AA97JA39_EUBMA|nr:early activation antigen CD69-like [Eublepharis macularius]
MADEDREERKVSSNCDKQGNCDWAHQELISSGPSGMTNADKGGPRFSKRSVISGAIILMTLLIVAIGFIIFQAVKLSHCQVTPGPSDESSCSQDWVKTATAAYFFSTEEGDWNSSQNYCTSCSGSLVTIDNQQEMDFIMRKRGLAEYWLGLWREKLQQPWKTPNGSPFNNWYTIEGGGLCAYLNDQVVSSTWCSNNRYWICKKVLHGT